MRKPLQGVGNIVRFNWHFYIISFVAIAILLLGYFYLPMPFSLAALFFIIAIILTNFISLAVSAYVYDFSGLYSFKWMNHIVIKNPKNIANINAGFDETSHFLEEKFPKAKLHVLDFYNPEKHTEVSIKRARKAYPPHPVTQGINTDNIPLENESLDIVFNILSAHEIREEQERISFFKELHRTTKKEGLITVTEHLRDFPNFLAYNIGFLHFHSPKTWRKTFSASGWTIHKEIKNTPFISTFILKKDGAAS